MPLTNAELELLKKDLKDLDLQFSHAKFHAVRLILSPKLCYH